MRKTLLWLAIAILMEGSGRWAMGQEQRSDTKEDRAPKLTVTGHGEVAAPPDRAMVRLGAEGQADDAATAQNQINTIIQKALQQIRDVGIQERKIHTSGLHLFPVFGEMKPGDQKPPRIVAFRASNTLEVEVNDLRLVGKVIDAGVAAGTNRIDGISFDIENDLPSRTQALQKAVAEARTKAEAIANALGVRLESVYEVTEGGVNLIRPQPMYGGAMMARMAAAPTPVEPGEVRVDATVTIHYRIAPGKAER